MSYSDEFSLERTLGEGAFGKVYLVKGNEDGKEYAMKIIDLRTSPEEEKELAVKEANLLSTLKHENVLSYTDSFENNGALCIVTEFCSRGDLSEYLEKRGGKKLEEDRMVEWFRQITSALKYLHGKKIIHRDIKTPNVFLTEKWDTKLGDMGLAKVLERPNAKAVTFCGSPYYMSPEIFSCKPYDAKSDIWALGVIVYEMATLERPFDAMQMHQLVFKIVHGGLPKMPTGYKPELSSLLSSIMQKDPTQRPTAETILKHPFFEDVKPPQLPPRPQDSSGAVGGVPDNRWGIKRPLPGKQKDAAGARAGPFDIKKLLISLSTNRKQSNDKKEKQKEEKAKGAVGGDTTVKGLATIMAKTHLTPKTNKFSKTVKKDITLKPTMIIHADVSVSDVKPTFNRENSEHDFDTTLKLIQSETAGNAFNVMQMIVRTLTGIVPQTEEDKKEILQRSDDPMGMMLRQIEHLQHYCTKVLNNDVDLFRSAYDLLGSEKDDQKIEEHLMNVLGPEKFGLCGVQMMFLKNFEYNLQKLQESPAK